jgi:ligand-binding sensor domain-containing protein
MNRSWSYSPCIPIKIILKTFVLLICLSGFISAQQDITVSNLRFDHLNFSSGLSFNIVTSIIKNKQGFIWIATIDGLNRYDGINFKIYCHDAHNHATGNENREIMPGYLKFSLSDLPEILELIMAPIQTVKNNI